MATVTYQFAKNQPVFYIKNDRIHENTIKEVRIDITNTESVSYTLQNDATALESNLYSSAELLCTALQSNIIDDND